MTTTMGLDRGWRVQISTRRGSIIGTIQAVYGAGDAPLAIAIAPDYDATDLVLVPWHSINSIRFLGDVEGTDDQD